MKRPDIYDVLEAVRKDPQCQSYVYAAKLRELGHNYCDTPLVRRRLHRLRELGKVRIEYRSWYASGYWSAT